jgi:hypothetical protein
LVLLGKSDKSGGFFMKYLLYIIIIITILVISIAYTNSPGTVSGLLLSEDIGARTMALGGAFGAIADDVHSMRYNPAGMAQLNQNEFSFTHVASFVDIYYESLMFGIPLKNGKTVLGVEVDYLNYGSIERRDEQNISKGNYSANETAFKFCFSTKTRKDLMFGTNIKMWSGKIDNEKANAFAVDIGALYLVNNSLNFGFALQNMGTKIKYIEEEENLPFNIKLSARYMPFMIFPPIISLDFNIPKNNKLELNAGIEFWLNEAIALRGGYRDKIDEGNISAGFGIRGYTFQLDYAYLFTDELDGAHRITATFRFGGQPGASPFEQMKQRTSSIHKKPDTRELDSEEYRFQLEKNLDSKTILFPPPNMVK